MTATEMSDRMRDGLLSSEEIVASCLKCIHDEEDRVRAWQFIDPEHALRQAKRLDSERREGRPRGRLHGIPVGVKDIMDTFDMPTENGTVLHAGRQPSADAMVVSSLRSAGAVILGKTVTTELALYTAGKTRNPYHVEHTPGGSSSGSAAAVASGMVPLALGTQTNGSIIRPASYCGVIGFKPSHGSISRQGILRLSRLLDQVGVFARSLEDTALITEELMIYDSLDPDMRDHARMCLLDALKYDSLSDPAIAFVKSPAWPMASGMMAEAFADLVNRLQDRVEEVVLPTIFDDAVSLHTRIMEVDVSLNLGGEYRRGCIRLSPILREMIERGGNVRAKDYLFAVEMIPRLNHVLEEIFTRYDVIMTPATPDSAPRGLESTGSPVFCSLWTLLGVPSVSLPLLQGSEGLPMGVQLLARKGDDARLLQVAYWLMRHV